MFFVISVNSYKLYILVRTHRDRVGSTWVRAHRWIDGQMGEIVPGEIIGRSVAVLLVWVITQTVVRPGPTAGRKDTIVNTEPSKVPISTCVSIKHDSPKRQHGGRRSRRERERE
jgi:hypothetical protein